MVEKIPEMPYRQMGPTGLKVPLLSFGTMTFVDEKAEDLYIQMIKRCWELGIKMFDCAESYGRNLSEKLLGRVLQKCNFPRDEIIVSTKIFYSRGPLFSTPVDTIPKNAYGLSRKHIIEGADNCLKRLQLPYVDILFCHRPDFSVPMEEICRGMNQVIEKGQAFYWGTSEWPAVKIMEAYKVCDKLDLMKPVVEQPQYNMLVREKFEVDYALLFDEYKMGTTIWSPLAGGFLTGKYTEGIPTDSRLTNAKLKPLFYDPYMTGEKKEITLGILKNLKEISDSLKCTPSQLAIAWTMKNVNVSTVLLGATSLKQLDENYGALKVFSLLTPELSEKIELVLKNKPKQQFDWKFAKPFPDRR